MDNSETLTTLNTMHRPKTNKAQKHTTQKKLRCYNFSSKFLLLNINTEGDPSINIL